MQVGTAVLLLCSGAAVPVGTYGTKWFIDRRRGRRSTRQNVESLMTWVLGEKATDFMPNPPPGARDQLAEVQRQLTQNGNRNPDKPTVLDRLQAQTTLFTEHVEKDEERHNEVIDRLSAIEANR